MSEPERTADNFIYEEAVENVIPEHPFVNKEIQVIYDNNQGIYNNQIIFSTQSVVGSGKYIDLANSYIEVPMVMAMVGSSNISAAMNPFSMGWKNGSVQLVDSIILQYNGTQMAQQSIFTNIIQHFKLLSTWTQEDLIKWGPTCYFSPDNPKSVFYTAGVASAWGDGTANNLVTPPTLTPMALWRNSLLEYNNGFKERMQNFYNIASGSNGLKEFTASTVPRVARANWTVNSSNVALWNFVLTIPLKQLHDFFNRLPILKAARVDLTININAFNGTITYVNGVAATSDGTMVTAGYNQVAGHCCPFMVAAAAVAGASAPNGGTLNYTTQPNGILGAAGAPITVAANVNGSGINSIAALSSVGSSNIFNNCRWYIPLYELDAEYERNLLISNPIKTIYYQDFYCYTSIQNQTTSVQALLASGVPNPLYVLLFPFFNNAVANSGNAQNNAPYQSMFDSAPSTTSQVSLTNIQIQCGGKTVFPLVELYDFQQYMDEFSAINSYNGGKSPCMTSGLISQLYWQNSPVYVADISRRLPTDVENNKSIQISATINSANPTTNGNTATIDIIAFVVYQRSASFNMVNGTLENTV